MLSKASLDPIFFNFYRRAFNFYRRTDDFRCQILLEEIAILND
jgi:hypothetical protein